MKKSRVPSPHFCNLLQVGSEFRQLWQFATRNGNANLVSNRKLSPQDPLPAIDCNEHKDTGYVQGDPFEITVVTVDGKPARSPHAKKRWCCSVCRL